MARSSSRVSNLKKSYKKIGKILLVNAPKGRVFLLTSAYCFEIVIIVHYSHTMGFQIVILQVSVPCVNSYLIALKDFEYVYSLDRKSQITSKSKNDVTYKKASKKI